MASAAPPVVPGSTKAVDTDLYSRQLYVYGESAMQRMARSDVLVAGMNGLGIEIAKNIALAGVKSLTLADAHPAVRSDMGTQYYITEADLGRNRAEVSAMRVSELNPYVQVKGINVDVETCDMSFFDQFQTVVLTDCSLARQIAIDEYCHNRKVPAAKAGDPDVPASIQFIAAEVRGVVCWAFADFGKRFEITDATGEEPIAISIASISNSNPALVTLEFNHHFGEGAPITFRDVAGMSQLNDKAFKVTPHDAMSFYINCDTTSYPRFGGYGEAVEIKTSTFLDHYTLAEELQKSHWPLEPIDYAKMDAPSTLYHAIQALHEYRAKHNGQLPAPWDSDAAAEIMAATKVRAGPSIDEAAVLALAHTARGALAPLTGFLGGLIAQEAIKAASGKFRPLSQWLFLDAREVIPKDTPASEFQSTGTRYDELTICVGRKAVEQLADTKTFMVGAGAIGCEMLKYFALLGVGTGPAGSVIVTDPDVIEKSNLNRQFLFRPKDLQTLKSQAAAQAVQLMNPALKPDSFSHKVGPDTERIFTDKFFESQDVVVNALDNVEARLYMDNRCILTQRPLLESGTLGTKAHVQTIVPFLTESYASRRDPPGKDFAVCTVKSFPTQIEHTIQWAKMKFSIEFGDKPTEVTKFFNEKDFIPEMIRTNGPAKRTLRHIRSSLIGFRVKSYEDCVRWARHRFDKLFNHDPRNLVLGYPVDFRNPDGSLFWAPPKRPPHPITFSADDALHVAFVVSAAHLMAKCAGLAPEPYEKILDMVRHTTETPYVPKAKKVQTDEKETESAPKTDASNREEAQKLFETVTAEAATVGQVTLTPQEFEKDDDTNFHVQFIMAASNLRARAYDIPEADFNKTKQIAGRIIPAIATTTASITGLVALELIKLRMGFKDLSLYRNSGMNLADPFVSMYEPVEVPKITLRPGLQMSFWDRFDINEGDITIDQVLQWFQDKYQLKVSALLQEQVMVYSWIDESRRAESLQSLLRVPPRAQYVYLDVVFSGVRVLSVQHVPPKIRFYVSPKRVAAARTRRVVATASETAGPADQ